MRDRDPGFQHHRSRARGSCIYTNQIRIFDYSEFGSTLRERNRVFPLSVADGGKRPGHNNPVVAGQHLGYPVVVAFYKCTCHSTLDYRGVGW
jgi:hypothetical protein